MKYSNRELFHLLSLPFYNLHSKDKPQIDWNIQSLIDYTKRVIEYVIKRFPESNVVLLGHSLGGSIAIKTLDQLNKSSDQQEVTQRIQGLIVIDVVEGTALQALPHMHIIVKNKYYQHFMHL